jgi:hypothetical protein
MIEPVEKRTRLLLELENLIGNECYNQNIQNHGPGGVFESAGRHIRYPITFIGADGTKLKRKLVERNLSSEIAKTGYYAFGANQLQIMRGLEKVLEYLEKHHELKV